MSDHQNIAFFKELLSEVATFNLYPQVLAQLQKDIIRAGITDGVIAKEILPDDLIIELTNLLLDKLKNAFDQYLNLLYAVDVSEAEMRNFNSENINEIANHAAYLILKREWKKVWFRNNSMNS